MAAAALDERTNARFFIRRIRCRLSDEGTVRHLSGATFKLACCCSYGAKPLDKQTPGSESEHHAVSGQQIRLCVIGTSSQRQLWLPAYEALTMLVETRAWAASIFGDRRPSRGLKRAVI